MPVLQAALDEPTSPPMYRMPGDGRHPVGGALPPELQPRQVTLRDRSTQATLVPFSSAMQVPRSLVAYLCSQLNKEIEKGDTYPMTEGMSIDEFGAYWFANFAAVMLLGDIHDQYEVMQRAEAGANWEKECLGSFYIRPNYPGRSSHICTGGFLVTDGARNRGVGRLMGEGYLAFAPRLGYSYSVFDLVYETNTPSCRIWDALGFKRIGRVKGCGSLKSYPDHLIDAIIYGRDLGADDTDQISEERFERIKFYLKHNKYPDGADRAEKSRLRSASTHYKLLPATDDEPEKLVLKGKEVISDAQRQYDVAWRIHSEQHGGINKTTAIITEKYHWVRIKDTVTQVIKNCSHCKDAPQQALAPYGRKESNAPHFGPMHPFKRDYSVPPGAESLAAHGYTADGARMESTPRPADEELEPDAERAPEDASFGALMSDVHGRFPEFLPDDGEHVPVDPALMNCMDMQPSFNQVGHEVRRVQPLPAFGGFANEATQSIEQGAAPSNRRTSRRSGPAQPMTTTPRESVSRRNSTAGAQAHNGAETSVADQGSRAAAAAAAQQAPTATMLTPASTRGVKRKAQSNGGANAASDGGAGSGQGRRVTRRLAGGTPQNVSEDDWRRQLDG